MIFKQYHLNMSYDIGLKDSLAFNGGMEETIQENIYQTEFIINLINYKQQKIKGFGRLHLVIQIFLCLLIRYILINLDKRFTFGFFWLLLGILHLLKLLSFINQNFIVKFKREIAIALLFLINFYCYNTLLIVTPANDALIPLINRLC